MGQLREFRLSIPSTRRRSIDSLGNMQTVGKREFRWRVGEGARKGPGRGDGVLMPCRQRLFVAFDAVVGSLSGCHMMLAGLVRLRGEKVQLSTILK